MQLFSAILATLALARAAAAAADPDIDAVAARSRAGLWPLPDQLAGAAATARSYAGSLNASCFWPDINYNDPGDRAAWSTANHASRVSAMTQALTAPGSPAFEDAALTAATHCALDVWLTHNWVNDNWWYAWIGIPLDLSGVYLMLGANRTSDAEKAALTAISFQSAWWLNEWGGGANLVWMLQIEIYRGAASGNASAVQEAFSHLWQNIVVGNVSQTWEGIVADQAYLFHGHQLLSSAYGLVWLQDVLNFWQIAAGTRFSMPTSNEATVARFVAEGDLELTWGSGWDFGTQGRGIDRPGLDFAWGGISAPTVRALAARPGAAPWADRLAYFADALDGHSGQPGRVSSKSFWSSDFVAHHRAGWGASLKMQGNNGVWTALPNECDNSENFFAEYTGSGVLNIYTSNEPSAVKDPYYEIFPLLNWHEINGVTAEASTPIPECGPKTGGTWPITYTSFVGAASDGTFSAAAFDYASHNTSVRKSYFFLDAAVVALGSGLSNGAGSPKVPAPALVRTTLVSRLLPASSAAAPLTVGLAGGGPAGTPLPDGNRTWSGGDVRWLHADGLGVWPTVGAAGGVRASAPGLRLALGNITGDYRAIGSYSGKVSGRLLTVSLDHGRALPAGDATAGFAYVLAPNVTAADMPSLDSMPGGPAGAACIYAGANVHGASAAGGEVVLAVFWSGGGEYAPCDSSAGGGGGVSADGAGMVVVRRPAAGGLTVSAAHPTRRSGALTVTVTGVAGAVSGAGCAAGAAPGSVVVTLPLPTSADYVGSSVVVTCTRA
jgi:hypothetical protein